MVQMAKSIPNRTKRPFVLAAVMLVMFIGAVEATIVATAMPAIIGDLGGFAHYSWVFSAYLLMNTITVLIYGKLSDLYGRKPILTIGVGIFLIGSFLCGLADSMEQLIIFRLIQGIGAGAVMPIATTIVGDIYTGEERAHVQGYLSSVWGISAIMGPAVGGLLVEYISWRWVFWVSIPLGLLSIIGVWLFLHETIEKKKPEIDYVGASLLTVAISSLMIILVEGGVRFSWFSPQVITLVIIAVSAFLLFILQEKRATEPMVPLEIWKLRPILIANLVSFTTGLMLIGISSFLPAYVQGVMEKSATIAGFALTAMSIGWPLASTAAGKLIIKIGYRSTSFIGGIFLVVGGGLFVTIVPSAGPIGAALSSFCVGVGMGLTSTSFIVLIQGSVDWKQRGITTATNMFMRNLGNTVGAALLGGILNGQILRYFAEHGGKTGQNLTLDSTNMLLTEEQRAGLSESVKILLQEGLSHSLHSVYIAVLMFGIISFFLVLLLPKKNKAVA
ncbi:MFS transporter [Siminovitchia terrae]|uniref:MFS transporter n=1 Tax=Siminovitchia terrae TaxID=1914933 RepID=A0A429X5S0_SIMTE|nr:MDR family MFS transporter [Siminovitchia terrae]RST58757.1 DHA2 family efflux MFS transporter permease subunit [Siminovitchia terrae]GIN89961.1 MFS transporter [Siminovitchia terrae]GIN94518.1 MFS transporter [Siminovitchia terrae]